MSIAGAIKSFFEYEPPPLPPQRSAPDPGLTGPARPVIEVSVKLQREDVPKFRRTYTACLNRDVSIEVTYQTDDYLGRYPYGMLNQTGGRWVSFDPDKPAERILDRDLLPAVVAACAAFHGLDRAFIMEGTTEFTDEKGARWRRSA